MSESSEISRVHKTTLPNGLRIVTEEIDSVRSISVGIWVKTGSRDESEEQAGITHFLEHMLFKGTEKRTAYDIALSMESVGGYLNAFTSPEFTCYYARCLDTKLEAALDVLSDMVLNSSFPEEEIDKEIKVVVEEMKMYKDSPDDYVFEVFNTQIFEKHPLGRPIIGFENTVSKFKRSDLQDYIRNRYTPENIIISVAGNTDHQKVTQLVQGYFNDNENKASVILNGATELTPYETSSKKLSKQIEQTHFIMGKRALSSDDPERYKLLITNTILGGGMSSRLHQNVREKFGYCYTIHSFNQSYKDSGMFGIYTGTDKQYVTHVKELIQEELRKLREEVIPEKELVEAKAHLKGKMLLSQESMSNRMMRLAKSEIYYNRYVSLDELVGEIDIITVDDILNFSQEFLIEEDFSETVLLPEEKSKIQKKKQDKKG
ncbi:MAG: pitrilysin family protein [Balneolales bacterium]